MTTYRIKLKLPINRREHLVFSLPQNNNYQFINNIKVSPKPEIIEEPRWGNKIAVFALNDVKDNIIIKFSTSAFIAKPYANNFVITDYKILNKIIFNSYLLGDKFVNGKDPATRNLARKIIGKERSINKIALSMYRYIINSLTYANPIEGLYTYKQAITERKTDCGGFSTLLLSLFQSVGIPGRLVVGFLFKSSLLRKLQVTSYELQDLQMHVWTEILLPDGTWFPMDPSIEWRRQHGLTKREGGFGFIPDDRLVVSYGEDFNLEIEKKKYRMDLLQSPIYL